MSDSLNKGFKMPSSDAKQNLEQAAVFVKEGKIPDAIACYESALASLERMYGEDQPELAECLEELGQAYESGGRLNDALRIHLRRLRMGEKILGPNNPAIVDVLFKLININETLGRPAEALSYCQKALACARESLPDDLDLIQQLIDRYRYLNIISGGQPGPNPLLEPIARPSEGEKHAAEIKNRGEQRADQERSTEQEYAADLLSGSQDQEQDQERDQEPDPSLAASPENGLRSLRPKVTAKTAKTRNFSDQEKRAGFFAQRSKELIITVFGLLVMMGLVLFLILHDGPPRTSTAPAAPAAGSAIYSRYLTADGKKEIRLISPEVALLINDQHALQMPVAQINCDWSGLISALWHSVQEKQIWAEKKDSQIRLENRLVYYSADGPEMAVVAKMKRLAGFGQASYLRSGEYPKLVSNDMISQFTYQNPLTGQDSTVQIQPVMNAPADGEETRAGLESGAVASGDAANSPCKIICYTVMANVNTSRGLELRGTKFFVRGCDRYGQFLSSAQPGRACVITASDAYLLGPETVLPPGSKNKIQARKNTAPTAAPMPGEKPDKNTRLWIISNLPCPLWLVHYLLPILLLGAALLSFIRAKTTAVDIKGRTLSAGSKTAATLAVILLLASMAVIVAQLFVFS